jgi:hypothetical protein
MKTVDIPVSVALAELLGSGEDLTQVVNEVVAAILIRQRKILCVDAERILGLSCSEVMNLFLKYRMDRRPDLPAADDLCQWAS